MCFPFLTAWRLAALPTPILLAAVTALLPVDAAFAQSSQVELQAALQRCRVMADTAQRLACYDALVGPVWGAPLDGAAHTKPGAAAAPLPQEPAARFGLPQVSKNDPLQFMEGQIAGRFEGWGPRSRIKLTNGQIWEVTDGTSGSYSLDSPKLKVRRGMMGSFFFEIEGVGQTPKVRRIQ